MRMTINSKIIGREVTFSRPGSEYVYVDLNGKPGTLGKQICYRGGLMGSTIMVGGDGDAAEQKFMRVCRNWLRSYIRNNRDVLDFERRENEADDRR